MVKIVLSRYRRFLRGSCSLRSHEIFGPDLVYQEGGDFAEFLDIPIGNLIT